MIHMSAYLIREAGPEASNMQSKYNLDTPTNQIVFTFASYLGDPVLQASFLCALPFLCTIEYTSFRAARDTEHCIATKYGPRVQHKSKTSPNDILLTKAPKGLTKVAEPAP